MAEEMQMRSSAYDAGKTQAAKAAAISEIVAIQSDLLKKNPVKADMADVEQVKVIAENVMRRCAEAGVLPNMEILAAALGFSRRGLYDFLSRHGDSTTAEFLDTLRTGWAGMRIAAMDRDVANATGSIFVLLNSSLGFTNEHKVQIEHPASPLEIADTAAARERILAALPDDVD